MEYKHFSTITSEHICLVSSPLAKLGMLPLVVIKPIADVEELFTFDVEHPMPITSPDSNPIWRTESVAARLIEAVAIAVHENIAQDSWRSLSRIILEHAEYLYTYHDATQGREQLIGGTALALAGAVCYPIAPSVQWRFAGFARMAEVIKEVVGPSSPGYLINPINMAFDVATQFGLFIPHEAIEAYRAALTRDLVYEHRSPSQLSDEMFFDLINLQSPGLEATKSSLEVENVTVAKVHYQAFLRRRLDSSQLYRQALNHQSWFDVQLLQPTFLAAKSSFERILYLSTQTERAASNLWVHSLSRISTIGIAAILFPEWKPSLQFLMLSLRRAKSIAELHIFPDGLHAGGSPLVHHYVQEHLLRFNRFITLSGIPVQQAFESQLLEMLKATRYLKQPDNCLPPLGESNHQTFGIHPSSDSGIELLDRQEFKPILSEAKVGTVFQQTSHAFPYAGVYVMRDSWSRDAQYLLFDAGQFGNVGGYEDKLSFMLYAHGRALIANPANLQHTQDVAPDQVAFRNYARSTMAHNSLIIDGKGQRRKRKNCDGIVPNPDTRWISTETFDFVEGWNKDGYGSDDEDALGSDFLHKRSIFYHKSEYYVLHDLVLGQDEHDVEIIFHLPPILLDANDNAERVKVNASDCGIVQTVQDGLSNIIIAPSDPENLEMRLQPGQGASQNLTYARRCHLPSAMSTILFPLRAGVEMAIQINSIGVTAAEDVRRTGFCVRHSQFTDLFLISDDGFVDMCTREIEFSGEYLFMRFDVGENIVEFAIINGRFLKWRGNVLVDLSEVQESYVSYD